MNELIKKIKLKFLEGIKPNKSFHLKVEDEHSIFVEEYGNPNGDAIIFLHGGPGGNVDYSNLRWFNLRKNKVILFEQRGCGRSKGEFFSTENNTSKLVDDIEVIRKHLNLGNVSLFGGSWGSCLALNYYIKYPENVTNMYLWGILLGTKNDAELLPEEYLSPEELFYTKENFFLPPNYVLLNIKEYPWTKVYITHGDSDNICSVENAKNLHRALPNSELFIEKGGFHSSSSKGIESFLKKSLKEKNGFWFI